MIQMTQPTPTERARAERIQRDEALAMIMLENSNQRKYWGLLISLRNSFTESEGMTNHFQKTPTATLHRLDGWENLQATQRGHDGRETSIGDGDYAFIVGDGSGSHDSDSRATSGDRGGEGCRSGGRRGGRGGRGAGRGSGRGGQGGQGKHGRHHQRGNTDSNQGADQFHSTLQRL